MFQRNAQSTKQRQKAVQSFKDLAALHQRMQTLLINMNQYLSEEEKKGNKYLADGLHLTKNRDSLAAQVHMADNILVQLRNSLQEDTDSVSTQYQFPQNNAAIMLTPDQLTRFCAAEIERITAIFIGYKTWMQQNNQSITSTNSTSTSSGSASISTLFRQLHDKQEESCSSTDTSKLGNSTDSTKSSYLDQ